LADSTTGRLYMETRQAVDPNGILWVSGSSAGGADRLPEQHAVTRSGTTTIGALRNRRAGPN
jgi:hypothetical protein